MEPWPGAICPRISACAQSTERPPEARLKTGPSPMTIWSPGTRRPNTRSASPATTRAVPSSARAGALCPCRRLPPNREFQILEPAAKRLGLHPFHIPMARNSVPYNGRGPCMRCRWCVGFACEVDAKNGSQNTVIPIALATGNCELRTECMAKEILTDDRGRARGVAYYDADGHLREQLSDIVIVSACAIESARLLLNSKSRLFPNGLGNRYDQVGRNLQGHHYTGAIGFFDFDTYDDVGPGASIAVCRLQPRHTRAFVAGACLPMNSSACRFK